ncbi:hypothetical protein [Hymenobacter nivis]|uniref:Uncharacterized protein n=1 Tax=Hymenobacter nivis TaxID=1850093 RepID=A0A502GVU6_9BACT|nr:hypothetical protein [Hymenobacter nivis]TPG66091.1 hypothetical protein EAH73_12030 [Hymenobacter nivis]
MDPYENPSPFTPAELAACCRRVALNVPEQVERLAAAADHFEALVPPVPVLWSTAEQRTEIDRLIKHPLITRRERTKVLLRMHTLNDDMATRLIAKLGRAIDERENGPGEAQQDLSQLPWLQTA